MMRGPSVNETASTSFVTCSTKRATVQRADFVALSFVVRTHAPLAPEPRPSIACGRLRASCVSLGVSPFNWKYGP